ncbi:protein-export chaperone SecB [Fusobacterium sp.]|uniref:protein-export chaperone SecB n=1 Tax=Fusobacterium sp. TaxID=68766 RepID=UPI0026178924|nr:protein-export chaperone SecB [Fusobacterium sp.]
MKESNLKLIGIPRIIESNFKLNPIYDSLESKKIELKLNIESEIKENDSNDHLFLCRIKVNITDKEEKFNIYVVAEGIFKIEDELEKYKEILTDNGPAILISFIRPYIVNLTTSAGMEPVVLPLLNLKK